MKNFEIVMEIIGQTIFETIDTNKDSEEFKTISSFLSAVRESYMLVQWPESQEYMEEEWFDEEAIFCGGSEEKTGDSAYFIPLKRII